MLVYSNVGVSSKTNGVDISCQEGHKSRRFALERCSSLLYTRPLLRRAAMILPLVVIILSLRLAAGVLHCPRTVHDFEAQPPPDDFMGFDADQDASTKRNGAADYLFRSLLRDEPLKFQEPERGRTYAFFAFKPGTPLENFCNGGAQ